MSLSSSMQATQAACPHPIISCPCVPDCNGAGVAQVLTQLNLLHPALRRAKELIAHIQRFAIITAINVSWPERIQRMQSGLIAIFSATSGNNLGYSPACLVHGDSYQQAKSAFFLPIFDPLLIVVLAVAVYGARMSGAAACTACTHP
jgi:hypothetical protein